MAIAVDASALAEVVARTERAAGVEALFAGEELIAPDLINAEVLSVLRGWLARSLLTPAAAARGVRNLATAPVTRLATDPLIIEMWSLRDNVTPYDAAYVVVARRNACPLLTLDRRLIRSPRLDVTILTPLGR